MELRNSTRSSSEEKIETRLKDIPRPKVRKIVHKCMLKYRNNIHYETVDIVKKILKKLKVEVRQSEMQSIRNEVKKWLSTNLDKVDDKESKKNILIDHEKKLINNSESTEIPSENITQCAENKKKIDTPSVPPVPLPICISCCCKKQPVVIDLTSDCDDIKVEQDGHVQTVDENDMHDLNAVLNAHKPDDNSFMKANVSQCDDSMNFQQKLYYSQLPFFNPFFYGMNPYINSFYHSSSDT